jgi:hypothetical protein
MKKENEITLGEAIDEMIGTLKLSSGLYEAKIQSSWEVVMGKTIARYTKSINLKGGKLYLTIESAPLKNELFYSREKIKEIFNKELGAEVIKEVFIY